MDTIMTKNYSHALVYGRSPSPGSPGPVDEENKKGFLGPAGSPAGARPQPGVPDPQGINPFDWVILTNPRSKREFDYLVREVGRDEILRVRTLLGSRKAYPLNLARTLGIKLPEGLTYMPSSELSAAVRALRAAIVARKGGDRA
jgi:hypothetical protein